MHGIAAIAKAHPMAVIGGIGAILILFLLMKRGGGSGGAIGDIPPNLASLQANQQNNATQVQLAQIGESTQLNMAAAGLSALQIQTPAEESMANAEISANVTENSANNAEETALATIGANNLAAELAAQQQGQVTNGVFNLASIFAPYAAADIFNPATASSAGSAVNPATVAAASA